jgi:hypothetical protein
LVGGIPVDAATRRLTRPSCNLARGVIGHGDLTCAVRADGRVDGTTRLKAKNGCVPRAWSLDRLGVDVASTSTTNIHIVMATWTDFKLVSEPLLYPLRHTGQER